MNDLVNSPQHYTAVATQLEPIDVLRYAPFNLGNALKYILRAPYKGNALLDYQKAIKYLTWALEDIIHDNVEPYDKFFTHYGLLLKKFKPLQGVEFDDTAFSIIEVMIRLAIQKIKEITK